MPEFSTLIGQTFSSVTKEDINGNDGIILSNEDIRYCITHDQDCCEDVYIESIVGDLNDLIDSPITMSELVSNSDGENLDGADSYTWTFIKLATVKGYVTIRFYGSSNGYYGESADLYRYNKYNDISYR